MRFFIVPALILILVGVGIDIYIYRRLPHRRVDRRVYSGISLLVNILAVLTLFVPFKSISPVIGRCIIWFYYAFISLLASKLVFSIFDLLASLPLLFHKKRVRQISVLGVLAALSVFVTMWWGTFNRFNIQEKHVEVKVEGLPDTFDGYRIVQISDMHVGSYGSDTSFISRLVSHIDSIRPDVVFFTGDIVNNRTMELIPFVNTLSGLNAKDGVYSILGNHDYGDYFQWESDEAKEQNMELMYGLQEKMGWKLLRNQTSWIRHGVDSIAVIGVENIGEPPFATYGNLDVSYTGNIADGNVKILLSHNPMHWVKDIAGNDKHNICLTLSGHTHAMQIELVGWSPAKWKYPTWGGLYTDSCSHNLYVNIGTGTIGAPMRIGATPEITVITLKKAIK